VVGPRTQRTAGWRWSSRASPRRFDKCSDGATAIDRAQRSTPPPYTGNALARSRRLQGQVNKSGWRFTRSVGLVKERLMNTYLGAELWGRMYELGNQVG
jgi:hypothetical protein